jgi:hypothetical protein
MISRPTGFPEPGSQPDTILLSCPARSYYKSEWIYYQVKQRSSIFLDVYIGLQKCLNKRDSGVEIGKLVYANGNYLIVWQAQRLHE